IFNYLESQREVNFVVHVMDPKFTQIDVHADVKVATGYDSPTVVADVITALTNYLSPANWGKGDAHTWIDKTKVYYNELISLVDSVAGVDRVSDLTVEIHGNPVGRVDVTIDNPAGLTQPSTITATAV